jgi:tetratricopeptide (TPR) repeat protein
MKKIISIIAFLTLTLGVFSQKAQKQFEYASALYEAGKFDSALYSFANIYNKGRGSETLIAKAYYNIGVIYLEQKRNTYAKEIFENILESDFDEMDRGGTGSGIMGEPYAIYKNRSCRILAAIALDEKDYETALKYTKMADKEYPYRHFCGNEYAANDIYLATMYARCYEGLGDKEKAIQTLLPHCIENGLASNSELVDQLCLLIKEKYSKEEIKQRVESAASGISVKEIKQGTYTERNYYVNIFNTELKIEGYPEGIDYRETKNMKGAELYRYYFKEGTFVKKLLQ